MHDVKTMDKQFQLDAIAWKCRQTGLSYGQLMNSYSGSEIQQIFNEFKKVVNARKQKNSRAVNPDKAASAEQPSKG